MKVGVAVGVRLGVNVGVGVSVAGRNGVWVDVLLASNVTVASEFPCGVMTLPAQPYAGDNIPNMRTNWSTLILLFTFFKVQ